MKTSVVNLLIAIGFGGLFALYAITGSPISFFLFGLGLLALFLWYFATDFPRRKRVIGAMLTVLLGAICVHALYPRKMNITDERLKYEGVTTDSVAKLREGAQTALTEGGYSTDSTDTRVDFPYKLEGSYNADTRAAFKKEYDGGVGRFYIIDGDVKGIDEGQPDKFVNIFRFWEPKVETDKRKAPNPEHVDVANVWQQVKNANKALDPTKSDWPIERGIDLAGGSSFVVKIDRPEDQERNPDEVDQVIATLEKRLNAFGGKDLLIAKQGDDRILIQMPGIDDEQRDAVKSVITKPSQLNFHMVDESKQAIAAQVAKGERGAPGYVAMKSKDPEAGVDGYFLLAKSPDFPGTYVKGAGPQLGNANDWKIYVDYNSEGVQKFGKLTSKNVGIRMAIVLDGLVLSAPSIRSAIWGTTEISGQFDEEEARSLAASLQNPLQNSLSIESESSVDPALGQSAIKQGIGAALAGLAITLLFVMLYYRFAGIVSLVGMIITLLLLLGAMAMFQFTLTLPGIAGIILTIGIAIDANVLIYERLKEEIGDGRTLPMAINGAYNKAFSAIFDANITTLITAFILYALSTGPVKGFAVTLIVGIFGSMFAALIVTRAIFNWGTDAGWLKNLSFSEFIPERSINFLGKSKKALIFSLTLIGLAIIALGIRNTKALGVDFRGGHMFTLQVSDDAINPDTVKEALSGLELAESPVVQGQRAAIGDERYVTIRMVAKEDPAEASKQVDEVKALLKEKLSLDDNTAIQNDSVGSAIGKELAIGSLIALAVGIFGILLYVTLRFEFSFALGAITALVHDILITLGIVVLAGKELSLPLVGAFLTIAGYSINDTIVVFDRIREGLKTKTGEPETIMNESISRTLRRTILTSLTTLLALITLFVFGGPALKDFAFTIIIGVLIGTYSSIFVASPIVAWWAKRQGTSLRKEILEAEARLNTPDQFRDEEEPAAS